MLAPATSCLNCSKPLYGRFCAECGQDTQLTAVTLRGLVRDYFAAYVAYDGLVWRTLALLVWKPGQLTLDFFAGKRARYLHPRRLYLFTSIVYFLCFAGHGQSHEGPIQLDCAALAGRHFGKDDISVDASITAGDDNPSWLRGLVAQVKDKQAKLIALSPLNACERFVETLARQIPTVAFVLLPVFALILKVFYWRRSYVEHLLFSVYEHSFVFLVFFLSAIAELAHLGALTALFNLAIVAHVFLALRRVYGKTWFGTSWRFAAIAVAYSGVFFCAIVSAALYAAWHTV